MTKMLLAHLTMPFVDAVIRTLHVRYGTKALLGRPYLKNENHRKNTEAELVVAASLQGHDYTGSFFLFFPIFTFQQMANRIFNESSAKDSAFQCAHVLQIAKAILSSVQNGEGVGKIEIRDPQLLNQKNPQTRQPNERESMILPFQTEFGPFLVELHFKLC